MKKILNILASLIIVLGVIGGAYLTYKNYFTCTFPVKYSIGAVDPKFKVTSDEVKVAAENAAARWNKADGKDLLEYDPNSKLTINLIYDSRQQELDQLNSQLDQLSTSKNSLDSQNKKFNDFLSQYQNQLDSYNAEVAKWNAQGGAPADVYQNLQSQKASLEQMQTTLKQMASVFNISAGQYNNNLDQLNTQLNSKKNELVTKGEYDPNTGMINIYTFGNTDELRLVLMHELGHAMGLNHITNPQAIMSAVLDETNLKDPQPTSDDLAEISQTCDAKLNYNSNKLFRYLRLLGNAQN